VGLEVRLALVGMRPGRIVEQRLASQLVGHAEAFSRAEAADSFAPICVFRTTNARPVAADERSDAACDHAVILAGARREHRRAFEVLIGVGWVPL
jgi:hypothetical protein